MSKVEELQAEIETLSDKEIARLRDWLNERDLDEWDQQIERDSESGKLDFLIEEAMEEKRKGTLKPL